MTAEFKEALQRAWDLHASGRLDEAEQVYKQLSPETSEQREAVLRALVELYLQARRPAEAIGMLVALTEEVPDRLYYYARLASLLEGLGHIEAAIDHYLRLLQRQPGMGAAHYNLALLLKKTRRYGESLAAYEKALACGLEDVQEVYVNMGVLYKELRRRDQAGVMYRRALEQKPDYLPALFNLAGLHEEAGEREAARELYRRILSLQPGHPAALARLAYLDTVTDADAGLLQDLREVADNEAADPLEREGACFALGKALDDLQRYDEAFAAYRTGNEFGRLRHAPYDRAAVEQAFDQLIRVFTPQRIQATATSATASPIFICGMFRSGSPLVEQILAAHPRVRAGGELYLLPWITAMRPGHFPDWVTQVARADLELMAREYLVGLRELVPHGEHVTDKRPDNYIFIGLIKMLFPRARIVYTRRQPVDNCLSVYFQQLGGELAYATDLDNCAHYYRQHHRLMAHWQACLDNDLYSVDYDALVQSPEPVVRGLLEYLGLDWDPRCLEFYQADNLVQTASVWQVREPLHGRSSGRRRHYAAYLNGIEAQLP